MSNELNANPLLPADTISQLQATIEVGAETQEPAVDFRQLIEGFNALEGAELESAVSNHLDSTIQLVLKHGGDRSDVESALNGQSFLLSTGVLDRWIREDGSIGDEPAERGVRPDFMKKINYEDIQLGVLARHREDIEAAEKDVSQKAKKIKRDWFSYQDVLVEPEAKQAAVDYTMASESADLYARTMAKELRRGTYHDIEQARAVIRGKFDTDIEKLPEAVRANLSLFAQSDSWILWDIAKQTYLASHPPSSDADWENRGPYRGLGLEENPLTTADSTFTEDARFMQRAIADRHIGWELQQMSLKDVSMSWLTDAAPDAADILAQPVKPDNQLHSWQYVLLGREAAAIGGYLHNQEAYST